MIIMNSIHMNILNSELLIFVSFGNMTHCGGSDNLHNLYAY